MIEQLTKDGVAGFEAIKASNAQIQAERDELVKALRLAVTTPHMSQDRYTLLVQDAAIAALTKLEGSK